MDHTNNPTNNTSRTSLIPKELLLQILSYAPTWIQPALTSEEERSLCWRWKYAAYKCRVGVINKDSIACLPESIFSHCYLLQKQSLHQVISFSRSHIYTDCCAFSTQTGGIIEQLCSDPMVTAISYTQQGFVVGREDGSVSINIHHNQCSNGEITVLHPFKGKIYIGSEDGHCIEFNIRDNKSSLLNLKSSSPVTCIDCSDCLVVAGFANGQIESTRGVDSSERYTVSTEKTVFAVHTAEGKIFSGHEDGRVRIWSGGLRLFRVIQTSNVITALAVLHELLAVGLTTGNLELYNWQTSEHIKTFTDHRKLITKIIIEQDRIMSCSLDGTIVSRVFSS